MLTSACVNDGERASACKEEGDSGCHSTGMSVLGRQGRLPMGARFHCVDCIHARDLERNRLGHGW